MATLALAIYLFPGQRLGMAFIFATGLGKSTLQSRIDAIEAKAILKKKISDDDNTFLRDLYRTLATGAKVSVVLGQTGRMMDHYLDMSGSDFQLSPEIFIENKNIQLQMLRLRNQRNSTYCKKMTLSSPVFYMPDKSKLDSVFGLYYGKLYLTTGPDISGGCKLRWRAVVPWNWPSYASLKLKYGNPHAESFPIPNILSLIYGKSHALYIDNGLGEFIARQGLAKSFVAYASWVELD